MCVCSWCSTKRERGREICVKSNYGERGREWPDFGGEGGERMMGWKGCGLVMMKWWKLVPF